MSDTVKRYSKTDKLGVIHHYVPQGYLRRFAYDGSEKIWAYNLDKNPYLTNVHNVAGQRDFYTYTDEQDEKSAELENVLAEVDDKGISMLGLLDALPDGCMTADTLTVEQKGDLLAYIAFQHTRNLQARKLWSDSYNQMMTAHMQFAWSHERAYHKDAREALGEQYTYERAEGARQAFLKGELEIKYNPLDTHFMGTTLSISEELYKILFTMKDLVLVSASGTRLFVASDNPVTHYLPDNASRRPFMGVGYINAIFQLPLSPNRCLLITNKDIIHSTFHYDRNAVNRVNFWTYYHADRWVFSNLESKMTKEEFDKFKHRGAYSHVDSPFDRAARRKRDDNRTSETEAADDEHKNNRT